jgi:hypothetical protein
MTFDSHLWHKKSRNDRNEMEVSVEIPVPARFRACDQKEFHRNFEPRLDIWMDV